MEKGIDPRQVATYLTQNGLVVGKEKEAYCLIFMCCGSAINEIPISLELRKRGVDISREIYFDRFIDESTIANLSNHANTHVSRQIVTSVDALETILVKTRQPCIVIGVNASFIFYTRDEAYRYHAFFSLCNRLSKENVCQDKWINILDGSNGDYSKLPCIDDCGHIRVYSTSWWTYANHTLSNWEILLGKR